jgi:ABC-type multidrug transport system ATPase subunit
LDVRAGEVVAIGGANGSGKSTLLRVLAGVSLATRGVVCRRGTSSVAFAPERLSTVGWMTVREYVSHVGTLRGLTPRATEEAMLELCGSLGLQPGPDVAVRLLSKGNNQKVALIQALLAPVDLLVLDEPHAGLDAAARLELDRTITARAVAGAAIVFSAHRPTTVDCRRLRLTAGQLSEEAVDVVSAEVRITVRGSAGRVEAACVDAGIDAEVAGPTSDGRWTVRASREASDDILRTLLAAGWSIDVVEPWRRNEWPGR